MATPSLLPKALPSASFNESIALWTLYRRLSKPAPIITMEYTSTVEELIKFRIKEGRFDDVQVLLFLLITKSHQSQIPHRFDQVLVIDPKKEVAAFELSQEKSKTGLGQVDGKLILLVC